MRNFLKTALLLTALTLLFVFFGRLIAGPRGMMVAFIFACLMNLGAYWFSDKLVLGVMRAQPLDEKEAPEVFEIVRDLSARAGLPMPKLYLIPSATPNAFATGRNPQHAVVAFTQGIFDLLNPEEFRGVLAHELAHIQNRDILLSTLAAVLAGAISMIASLFRWAFFFGGGRGAAGRNSNPLALFVMALVVPVAALLIQLAISRSREYGADHKGAQICGNPLYLASALQKIEAKAKRLPMREIDPSFAHLFIQSPLTAEGFAGLFRTHPPLEERVARLVRLSEN